MTLTVETPAAVPDFSDPATFSGEVPHAAFDRVRAMPGLYWQPATTGAPTGGFWLATRFADIQEIEGRTEDVTSNIGFNYPLQSLSETPEQSEFQQTHLMRMDPPRHGRVRRVAATAFGPRVVAHFDEWIREIVDEGLDLALQGDYFDWVTDVAKFIPSRVVAQILGVPRDRRQDIVDWTDAIFAVSNNAEAGKDMLKLAEEVFAYCLELRELKLREPGDDMATSLAHAMERGELDTDEYVNYVSLLMLAGYETTHTLMGQAMRLIVEDEDVRRQAWTAVDEGRTSRLIDEFLRFVTPAMNMARIAKHDFEVAGTQIHQGDLIQLMFTAANRDPAVFSDPHVFRADRPETANLTFGAGPHRCIGNALAKLEAKILFEQLRRRRIDLRLDGEPRRGWSTWINQLHSLPVRVVPMP